jgi:hypothetical protein
MGENMRIKSVGGQSAVERFKRIAPAKVSEPRKQSVITTVIAIRGGAIPVKDVSENLWQVRFNLSRLGIVPSNTNFDRSRFADLVGSNSTAPFSGVGATGTNPTTGSIPLGDQRC